MTTSPPPSVFHMIAKTADLRQALRIVSLNPELRSARLPILACVLIRHVSGSAFEVEARGLDHHIATQIAAMAGSSECGAVAIPCKTLQAFCEGAEAEDIVLHYEAGSSACTVTSGDLTGSIIPMPVSDAPVIAELNVEAPEYRSIPLAEGVLAWLFDLTLPFVSTEETRYYLNGVAFELATADGDSVLRAVATNGHMLGHREAKLTAKLAPYAGSPIVQRDAVTLLHKLTAGKEVTMAWDGKRAIFSLPGVIIRTTLIDGTFPDWRRVVPQASNRAVSLDTGRVLKFCGVARGVSGVSTGAIKIERHERGLSLTVRNPDGGDAGTVIPADAPEFEPFGVSAKLVATIAKAMRCKALRLAFGKDQHSPMTFTSPDDGRAGFAVLMPMRI